MRGDGEDEEEPQKPAYSFKVMANLGRGRAEAKRFLILFRPCRFLGPVAQRRLQVRDAVLVLRQGSACQGGTPGNGRILAL